MTRRIECTFGLPDDDNRTRTALAAFVFTTVYGISRSWSSDIPSVSTNWNSRCCFSSSGRCGLPLSDGDRERDLFQNENIEINLFTGLKGSLRLENSKQSLTLRTPIAFSLNDSRPQHLGNTSYREFKLHTTTHNSLEERKHMIKYIYICQPKTLATLLADSAGFNKCQSAVLFRSKPTYASYAFDDDDDKTNVRFPFQYHC